MCRIKKRSAFSGKFHSSLECDICTLIGMNGGKPIFLRAFPLNGNHFFITLNAFRHGVNGDYIFILLPVTFRENAVGLFSAFDGDVQSSLVMNERSPVFHENPRRLPFRIFASVHI